MPNDAHDPALRLGRLGQVSLLIRDLDRAEAFYGTTLGLRHVFTFGDLSFFDLDGTRLYLHRKDESDWRPGSVLYFVVEDIGAAWEELGRRGVERTGEGNTLALMEQVDPASAVSREPG